MKPFSGFKAEQRKPSVALPAGGYVAKILKAEEVVYSNGKKLVISFDIAEGEHKDHFKTNYNNQNWEDKKWKGNYYLSVPNDDESEDEQWKIGYFNNAMGAIEESNPGYHWDWNETGLKGKIVGVLFCNEEWEFNGRTGWHTKCCDLTDVDTIRNNKFSMPKDKPLKKGNTAKATFTEADNEDDLPF